MVRRTAILLQIRIRGSQRIVTHRVVLLVAQRLPTFRPRANPFGAGRRRYRKVDRPAFSDAPGSLSQWTSSSLGFLISGKHPRQYLAVPPLWPALLHSLR